MYRSSKARDTGQGRPGELLLALRWLAFDGRCSFSGDLLLKPILEVAGQDISHWFDPKTRDVCSVGTWGWWKQHCRAGEGGREYLEPEIVIAPILLSKPSLLKIRKQIDPLTGCLRYRTPRGRFVHIPPPLPRSDWANDFGTPWWMGTTYLVGRLSAKTRNIRIINTLTSQEHTLQVRSGAWGQARGEQKSFLGAVFSSLHIDMLEESR